MERAAICPHLTSSNSRMAQHACFPPLASPDAFRDIRIVRLDFLIGLDLDPYHRGVAHNAFTMSAAPDDLARANARSCVTPPPIIDIVRRA
ncbi:protein of unknown function [Methylocella tundrae]|uniref:Uncharacterized protein n=1 Tax=Methylocella tundrae TaxID=227605 RepID=A0A4V6IMT0_METTU|nr:protein of unknown function [Methylocella tundrae]